MAHGVNDASLVEMLTQKIEAVRSGALTTQEKNDLYERLIDRPLDPEMTRCLFTGWWLLYGSRMIEKQNLPPESAADGD